MSACISPSHEDELVVETVTGKVRGHKSSGAISFRGIPYARAARFQRPVAAEPWAGIRDCFDFGASAPQSNPSPPTGKSPIIMAHLPRPAGAAPPSRPPESEDCQVLNIWTARAEQSAKRPVMVWLHGGFFSGSSGSTVDGSALAARHGAVVVSLNHRLNAFGFADLSAFGEQFADSANTGMLDIVAALEWIKANIEGFGGDPSRIMVFGTSGGGMKTSLLMASPHASGLIHRAGVQSGPGLEFLTRDQAAEASEKLLHETGLNANNADDLRHRPVEQILAAFHKIAAQMRPNRFSHIPCFGPVVDGDFLPRQPFSPDAAPLSAQIPMIIGSNSDEMTFFMGNDEQGFMLDEAGFDARVRDLSAEHGERLSAHYRERLPELSPAQRWIRLFSDYSIALPICQQARRHAAISDGKTWAYQLALPSPALGGKLGSTHTIETPLIFDTAQSSPLLAGQSAAQSVADEMAANWASFAADGKPANPSWLDFGQTDSVMRFDANSSFTGFPERENLELLAELLPQ